MKYLCKPKQTTNKAKKKQINESKIRVNKQCACVSLYCICNVQGGCGRGGEIHLLASKCDSGSALA